MTVEDMNDELELDEEFDEDDDFETLTLIDEEGNSVEFELVDEIEYQEKNYLVLLPLEDDEDSTVEVVIVEVVPVEGDEDEEEFALIDDEELLNTLFEMFKNEHADEFDFVEE